MNLSVPIGPGELVDKITILQISPSAWRRSTSWPTCASSRRRWSPRVRRHRSVRDAEPADVRLEEHQRSAVAGRRRDPGLRARRRLRYALHRARRGAVTAPTTNALRSSARINDLLGADIVEKIVRDLLGPDLLTQPSPPRGRGGEGFRNQRRLTAVAANVFTLSSTRTWRRGLSEPARLLQSRQTSSRSPPRGRGGEGFRNQRRLTAVAANVFTLFSTRTWRRGLSETSGGSLQSRQTSSLSSPRGRGGEGFRKPAAARCSRGKRLQALLHADVEERAFGSGRRLTLPLPLRHVRVEERAGVRRSAPPAPLAIAAAGSSDCPPPARRPTWSARDRSLGRAPLRWARCRSGSRPRCWSRREPRAAAPRRASRS